MVSHPLDQGQVPLFFPLARPYLQRLHDEFEGDDPQDIYRRLLNRSLTLHLCVVNNVCEGFMIAEWSEDECFVLSAAAFERAVISSSFGDIISSAVAFCAEVGVGRMAFRSPRPAWHRIAQRHGFQYVKDDDRFVREIP